MIQAFYTLWDLLVIAAPQSLVKAAIVFVAIICMRLAEVLPTSKWARAANLVFSVLLSGIMVGTVKAEEVYIIAMTTTFAGLFWKFAKSGYEYVFKQEAFPEKAPSF